MGIIDFVTTMFWPSLVLVSVSPQLTTLSLRLFFTEKP